MSKKNSIISRLPFFYGYIIIFAGTVGVLMSSPGQTIGVSVFTDFLIDDLGINRENLSLAYLIGTLTSSFLLTYAGKFFDKFGARVTASLAGFSLGLSLFFLSDISKIASFITNLTGIDNVHLVVFVLLTLGFFFIRFSGQGVLTMASKNMIMKWFDKRRGFAGAIMGVSISFGFSNAPLVFDWFISIDGWRYAWQLLALIVGVVFVIFAIIFYRDNPQSFGLIPDGKDLKKKKKQNIIYHPEKDFTLKEAKSTFAFWVFNLSTTLFALYGTAFTFHIVDIYSEVGIGRLEAIAIFLPTAVTAVIFELAAGYFADFTKMRYLLTVQLSGMILFMISQIFLSPGIFYYTLILGLGINNGLFGIVSSVTWPRYYGTKHLGAITGFNMSWIVAGSALGPYLFSLFKVHGGSYDYAGICCIIIAVILWVVSFKAENVNVKLSIKD